MIVLRAEQMFSNYILVHVRTSVARQFLFSQTETVFVVLAGSRLFIYGLLMS